MKSVLFRVDKLSNKVACSMIAATLAGSGILLPSTGFCAINITLPFEENFDSFDYTDLIWIQDNYGGRHEWINDGGWEGGAARFFPPTSGDPGENYNGGVSGLGAYENMRTSHMNARFLVKFGQEFTSTSTAGGSSQDKFLVALRGNDERAYRGMVLLNYGESHISDGQPYYTFGLGAAGRPYFEGGYGVDGIPGSDKFWPNGRDSFKVRDYSDQWICLEYEAWTDNGGGSRLYIWTQDGRFDGLYLQTDKDFPGSFWKSIQIMGGYYNGYHAYSESNYVMFDKVAIDDSFIGPPAGFISGETSASNDYYVTNPRLQALSVMSLADNNTVTAGDKILNLDLYERGSLWSPNGQVLTPGMKISATGPLDMGSITNATDTPIPASMLGRSFAMPHLRNQHHYHMLSPEQDASVEVLVDGTLHRLTLPQGEPVSFDAGNSNSNVSAVITSDTPIAVSHRGQTGNWSFDAMPLPPAATELWGIRSTIALIGATQDDTEVTVYASNGNTQTLTLQAGQKGAVTVGTNTPQAQGSAIHVVANRPVNAIQVADGDGEDATAFYPTSQLNTRFGIPKDTQYIAIACPQPHTTIELYRVNGEVEVKQCSAQGNRPGKAYFGNGDSNKVSIPQASYLESNNPIYVIYEVTGSEDEHNLVGTNKPM
jgi:hypothetical protein